MSHKLQVGEMRSSYLTDKEIWSHFNYIFSSKSRNSTTYKFVLIKSIIENLYNVNKKLELNYFQLFGSFAKIYWNLVVYHGLNQINMVGKKAEVQSILLDFQQKHQIPKEFVFDKLSNEYQIKIINKVKKKCKVNVMGALFGDTTSTIYTFDNESETVRLNISYYSFMQRFQRVLNYLTNYHLALFLEKFNEKGDTTNILIKVVNVSRRSSLDQFYQVLSSFYEGSCFYCKKEIKRKNSAHVDHFIPWSFIQADQLWNLVISCSTCNLAKRDKLAHQQFLDNLIDRNNQLLKIPDLKTRMDMEIYTPDKLQQLYTYSNDNGFTDIWIPKRTIVS
jgi:5-methylcytosine-specific restriction endonuclease McrA